MYILTYNKEIKDIDNYGVVYPTKLKSYIANNYSKIFLKRDFNFFTDGYFQYSHQFLFDQKYKYKYAMQNKLLFPEKKLVEENDSAHKDISSIVNELVIYECEMITVKGSILEIFLFLIIAYYLKVNWKMIKGKWIIIQKMMMIRVIWIMHVVL